MKSIIIAGAQGSGKSSYIKNKILQPLLETKKFLILDVQQEYPEHKNIEKVYTLSNFLEKLAGKTNTVCIIEEATIFIKHKRNFDEITHCIVSCRHNNNLFILVYHGLHLIPMEFLTLSNYLFLFKTGDNFDYIEKKFSYKPEIAKALKIMHTKPFPIYPKFINEDFKDTYIPILLR